MDEIIRKKNFNLFILSLLVVFIVSCTPVYLIQNSPNFAESIYARKTHRIVKQADQNPENFQLLFDATSELTMYSYAFLMEKADRKSVLDYHQGKILYKIAQENFIQAKKYGLRGLKLRYPEIDSVIGTTIPKAIKFTKEDVPILYWTAAAWGGAISASKGDLAFIVELPKVGWILERAIEVDSDWNKGALYLAMISYSMKRTDQTRDSEKLARMFFEKVINASNGNNCSPYVSLAELVSVKNQDKKEFEYLLNKALAIDINNDPDFTLSNTLAQVRSKWLLEQTESLFY